MIKPRISIVVALALLTSSAVSLAATLPGPYVVFFELGKSTITPQAAAILTNAAQAYPKVDAPQVMLAGHTDSSGSPVANLRLAQRRVAAVRAFLAGRGIPQVQMTLEPFGDSRPLVDTPANTKEMQNRRVEITFGPGSGW